MDQTYIDNLKAAVKKAAPLCPIFDRVSLTSKPGESSRNPLAARVLSDTNIVHSESENMVEALEKDLAMLSLLKPEAQRETFGYLLQKYGWRIGAPDGPEVQDVAYCDLIRVEKALAQNKSDDFLLVKGDLSGIQDYIYGNIQQKTAGGLTKVAKRLRGRSILVTLISDFLANLLLKEFDCSNLNLLFVGGGHFNVLLPDSEENRLKIAELDHALNREMQAQFDNQLQLVLAFIPCTRAELQTQSGKCFEKLNDAREQKKYQPSQHHLAAHFYPAKPTPAQEQEERDNWEMDIGEWFPKRNFLLETVSDAKAGWSLSKKEEVLVVFETETRRYSLLMAENYGEIIDRLNKISGLDSAMVLSINDTSFLPDAVSEFQKSGKPVGFGFRFLGKNVPLATFEHTKTKDIRTRPQTFEEIARGLADGASEASAEKKSLEMLGALKLDVDDLGYIFNQGLGKGASLAQLVSLSREMHYFFSAHFDKLAREHSLYVIYSGGDDAFAVGSWEKLIEFVLVLQRDFESYVGKNRAVHFSAGLFFGDPKYPVGRFSLDAGKLLDAAKDSTDKDRVHIFNHPLKWNAFHAKIDFGKRIAAMLGKAEPGGNRKLTMAFAYKLIQLVKTSFYERNEKEGDITHRRGAINMKRFARNVANLRYLFARNGFEKAEADKLVQGIEKEVFNDFIRNFDFGEKGDMKAVRDNLVALNFALYTIRSQKNS